MTEIHCHLLLTHVYVGTCYTVCSAFYGCFLSVFMAGNASGGTLLSHCRQISGVVAHLQAFKKNGVGTQ